MPVQLSYPGVYVEEIPSGSHTITGVPTAITAFIGRAPKGPVDDAITVTSMGNFEQMFGELAFDFPLTYAVKDFFQNGGSEAIIIRRFIIPQKAQPASKSDSSSSKSTPAATPAKAPAKKGANA